MILMKHSVFGYFLSGWQRITPDRLDAQFGNVTGQGGT